MSDFWYTLCIPAVTCVLMIEREYKCAQGCRIVHVTLPHIGARLANTSVFMNPGIRPRDMYAWSVTRFNRFRQNSRAYLFLKKKTVFFLCVILAYGIINVQI